MAHQFRALFSEFERKLNEYVSEISDDTEELHGLPYPFVASSLNQQQALFYLDTFFTNLGLIRLKKVELARHNVENLIFLFRKRGFVPESNRKDSNHAILPLLPWMVRDIYRATGDKEWLRRLLPDVYKEFQTLTDKNHKTSSGLYRYMENEMEANRPDSSHTIMWYNSPRFEHRYSLNPIDLNAILYRNALIIYDLQKEVDGSGDKTLQNRADQIKQQLELCWDSDQHFYFDNNFQTKELSPVKSLAGFVPLFVKGVDSTRAQQMQEHLTSFLQPGGLSCYAKTSSSKWQDICVPPYFYLTIKGMFNYDFMEDAADLATNWLKMVKNIWQEMDELWEWYNVKEQTAQPTPSLENHPSLGWTMGTYVALVDDLGLE